MNETDYDIHNQHVWKTYQSSLGTKYQDALNKAIYESKLDASGLLVDEEKKRIVAKVKHEKLLDELLGEAPVAVTSNYRTNTIMGKSATSVIMDDPWDI